MGVRGELRLQLQAVNQRWIGIEDLQQDMLSNLSADLLSENPRIRDAARKILVAITGQNQRDEHHRAVIELAQIRDRLSVILSQSTTGNIGGQPVDSDHSRIDGAGSGQREEADGTGTID